MAAAGNKCVYAKCGNSRYRTKHLKMFPFPYKDSDRCEKWKLNTGNSTLLNLEGEELKSKHVCEEHFGLSSFINSSKHRLVHDAVPLPYKDIYEINSARESGPVVPNTNKNSRTNHWDDDVILPLIIPSRTYPITLVKKTDPTKKNVDDDNSAGLENFYCSPIKEDAPKLRANKPTRKNLFDETNASPRNRKLIYVCKRKTKQIRKINNQVQNLKKKLKTIKSRTEPSDFVKAQLNTKKVSKWSQSVRDLAVSVYYTSPAAYKCLKKHNIKLPGVSTLKKWLNSVDFGAGFSDDIFAKIKNSVTNLSRRHKICILSFDEMAIKKQLDYNKSKDIVEGFQDLGPLGRSAIIGDHALVFYIKGVFGNWKTPVAYFISANSITAKNLTSLIKICLEKLENTGLDVRAIVCDQGTNNRSAVKQLGVKDGNPYFVNKNKKYYAFYDVPHLIKSVRNQLLQHNFLIDGNIVSWYDIKQTYYVDAKSETARSLPKLTLAHVRPNPWQKMRVKYAVQVFSNTMSAAIKTAVKCNQVHKPAVNTALFIQKINDLFDALNSRTEKRCKQPYLCAISSKNVHVEQLLQESIQWISGWKTEQGKCPPCFKGLKDTILGMLFLYTDLKEENILSYLPTRRLNQDCLENLFAFLRKRCGYERNPSVRMTRLNLRAIINHNLKLSVENSNCENNETCGRLLTSVANYSKNESTPRLDIKISGSELEDINLESNARKYTAGYVIKRCIEKFNCDKCRQTMVCSNIIDDASIELIMQKKYSKLETNRLCVPSDLATRVFSSYFILLKQNYQEFWAQRGVINNLDKLLNDTVRDKYPTWYESASCENHRRFVSLYLIFVFLHKKTLWKSRQARMEAINKKNKAKKHPKLAILNHQ